MGLSLSPLNENGQGELLLRPVNEQKSDIPTPGQGARGGTPWAEDWLFLSRTGYFCFLALFWLFWSPFF